MAIKIGCGKPAYSAAHDDEVIDFPGVVWISGCIPESAIAKGMGDVIGARLTASHAFESRWIGGCGGMGGIRVSRGVWSQLCEPGGAQSSDANGDAVEKIAASDAAPHSKFAVAVLLIHVSSIAIGLLCTYCAGAGC